MVCTVCVKSYIGIQLNSISCYFIDIFACTDPETFYYASGMVRFANSMVRFVNGTVHFVNSTVCFLHGTLCFAGLPLHYIACILHGTVRFMDGTDRFVNGTVHFLRSTVRFVNGTVYFLAQYGSFLRCSVCFTVCITRNILGVFFAFFAGALSIGKNSDKTIKLGKFDFIYYES